MEVGVYLYVWSSNFSFYMLMISPTLICIGWREGRARMMRDATAHGNWPPYFARQVYYSCCVDVCCCSSGALTGLHSPSSIIGNLALSLRPACWLLIWRTLSGHPFFFFFPREIRDSKKREEEEEEEKNNRKQMSDRPSQGVRNG